jgi:hypothetical protein
MKQDIQQNCIDEHCGSHQQEQFECWRMLGDSQSEVAGRVFCTFFAGS